jgi:hypothetical protein
MSSDFCKKALIFLHFLLMYLFVPAIVVFALVLHLINLGQYPPPQAVRTKPPFLYSLSRSYHRLSFRLESSAWFSDRVNKVDNGFRPFLSVPWIPVIVFDDAT